ncbi:asparagine synthase-related protein, partial [Kitasatospora sp. NPDC093558]|uniref:asparagine synthase-related protein n=1 Tax=Kitasatospora sp. NPDC093558 TaxID=3155201 RepID=UPI00343533C5
GPWVPPWLSSSALRRLRDELQTAARTAAPLHDRPHQHTAAAALRALARWNRLQADAASCAGVLMAYPFQDRAVIEAALSVKGEDRGSPFEFKPLLTSAMRGIVPDPLLTRRTKGGYSADDHAAAKLHRQGLAVLLRRDSALADHGLIDPAPLADAVASWQHTDSVPELLLLLTLNAEIWLRTAEGRPLTQETRTHAHAHLRHPSADRPDDRSGKPRHRPGNGGPAERHRRPGP